MKTNKKQKKKNISIFYTTSAHVHLQPGVTLPVSDPTQPTDPHADAQEHPTKIQGFSCQGRTSQDDKLQSIWFFSYARFPSVTMVFKLLKKKIHFTVF